MGKKIVETDTPQEMYDFLGVTLCENCKCEIKMDRSKYTKPLAQATTDTLQNRKEEVVVKNYTNNVKRLQRIHELVKEIMRDHPYTSYAMALKKASKIWNKEKEMN